MLNQLAPDIQKTADLIEEINTACTEQRNGATQIENAIQSLDQNIQKNVTASTRLATTAEEMRQSASKLQSSIAYFDTEPVTLIGPVSA